MLVWRRPRPPAPRASQASRAPRPVRVLMQDSVLFFDEPAEQVVHQATSYFAERGLVIVQVTQFSVSFAGLEQSTDSAVAVASAAHAGSPSSRSIPGQLATSAPGALGTRTALGVPGTAAAPCAVDGTTEMGPLAPHSGQVAAVPVQLRPEWCRVWVSTGGQGTATAAAEAFVAAHRDRSLRVAAAVQELEAGIYSEARWPAYEQTLRASLVKQGLPDQAVQEKVAAFKRRWLALGRKAAKAPPEEPQSA